MTYGHENDTISYLLQRQREEIRPTDTGEMKVVGTPTQLEQGWLNALSWMEKVLDTLQEPIDKWSNKERKAKVKKTGEIVCGFTDGQGHFDIPTDHNEFIRYNLDELEFDTLQEQPVNGPFTGEQIYNFLKEQQGFPNWHSNPLEGQPVDLDEEIDRFLSNATPITKGENKGEYIISRLGFRTVARHFYELGRQSKEQPVCEDKKDK